jgi:hypothetical protein
MHQQAVLREEPRKQHAVPVLERHLVREPVDRLRTPLGIEFISELTPVGAQRIAELARIGVHVPEGLVVVDRERTKRLASARLSFSASGQYSA